MDGTPEVPARCTGDRGSWYCVKRAPLVFSFTRVETGGLPRYIPGMMMSTLLPQSSG